jgi:hypothetical protein
MLLKFAAIYKSRKMHKSVDVLRLQQELGGAPDL